MDEYEILKEIIENCLWLDAKAHCVYLEFARNTENEDLKREWHLRAEEEKDHLLFWKEARELVNAKHLPLVIEDPFLVREKISRTRDTIEKIMAQFNEYSVYSEQLKLAFMLETYMLHPALMVMFRYYSFINDEISRNYEKHIRAFIEMVKKFNDDMNMLYVNLFCENIYDLYHVTMSYLDSSLRDILTGLYNRRGFINHTSPALSMAEKDNRAAGIIIIDFDDFKLINDRHGHHSGDVALQTEAAIINSCVRDSDVVGRYGGDEFIIFTAAGNLDLLGDICERIRKATEEKSSEVTGFPFTVSLGGAIGKISNPQEKYLAEIINNADSKLYEAKRKGKNQWVV